MNKKILVGFSFCVVLSIICSVIGASYIQKSIDSKEIRKLQEKIGELSSYNEEMGMIVENISSGNSRNEYLESTIESLIQRLNESQVKVFELNSSFNEYREKRRRSGKSSASVPTINY